MTTTSPALISPAVTAAMASSSDSKTRAGPSWWTRSWPESFTTQPSGARLPRRMARPPVGLSGSSSGRTTRWPSVSSASRACSPIVLPVTVLRVLVQQAGLEQALGDHGDAARVVQVPRHVAAARLEVAQQRRLRGDAVEVVDVELHAGLAGDGEQVQHAVRRAAAHGDRRDGVLQRLAGDDVARALAAGEDVHDQPPGLARRPRPSPRRRRGPSPSPSGRCPAPRRPWPWCWR